ncbi:type II toxin-antitoxin system VapC family toxin [Thermoactinospora rubra]|uniref:type II toxin-antitoxin system VapC family toxin n=1 Tax=Thermoactinospora rubra TaxID=1088767 RepID=UPI00130200C9|nr:PIN domain-containing protein [Thermoactinospora rubra]
MVLDTNIVSAIIDPDDALHAVAMQAVLRWEGMGGSFAVSSVTWAELRVGALRRGQAGEEVLAAFRTAALDEVLAVTEPVAAAAARLRANDLGLRLPDALIAATAQVAGAGVLLSADQKLAKALPGVVELVAP